MQDLYLCDTPWSTRFSTRYRTRWIYDCAAIASIAGSGLVEGATGERLLRDGLESILPHF